MAGASVIERLRDPGETALGALLLAPAFLLLALIVVYPIATLIFNSFFDLRLSGGSGAKFVGFENYVLVLKDGDFWNATWNTVLITLITVPGALVAGLGLALLANLPFKRQWPVRLALLLPWALPLAFAGLIFAWFFHTEYGVVNDVVRRLGFGSEPTMWLLRPGWAFAAICLTIVWKTSSFMALILLAGLQMIPRSLYEAAEVDGATPLAAVLADHDPDADALDRRRADLPHHHRAADVRHPVHDDQRRPGQRHRDAGHADPQDDDRLPRRRLRLDARRLHVPAVARRDRGVPAAHREGTHDASPRGKPAHA